MAQLPRAGESLRERIVKSSLANADRDDGRERETAEREAEIRDDAHAELPDQRLREAGADDDAEREGHEREAGLQRPVAEDLLQVERREVEPGDRGAAAMKGVCLTL